MKKYILYSLLGLILTANTFGETKKALFIGNSLMSYNGYVANITKDIAAANGHTLTIDNYTYTGSGFDVYWAAVPGPHPQIKLGGWDYVVMNDITDAALKTPAIIQSKTYDYATLFEQEIRQYNPGAKVMIFMNWGFRDGYSGLVSSPTSGGDGVTYTSLTMSQKVESVFKTWANANNATVSAVCAVWRAVQAAYPSYNLYLSALDGKHPNALGTYIASITTYTSIFRKDPTLSTYIPSGVPTQLTADGGTVAPATFIANVNAIAKTVIYDNLNNWYIGTYDPVANFETYRAVGNDVTFTNTSVRGISYLWDFGDGTTSTSANPTHIYANANSYNVTLTVTGYAGYTSTSSQLVNTADISPLRPILSVSTSALSGLNYKVTLGPSEVQTFTVGGANLLDNLTLTVTGNFELKRAEDLSYTQNPIMLTKDGTGLIPTTTISVRLKSGLAIGSNNGSIAISSTDFATNTINLSGDVAPNPPTIYVANLTDFRTTPGSPSAEQQFILNGHDLTTAIVITASPNFEISTATGALFSPVSTVTLNPVTGNVALTPIYVRLKAGLAVQSYSETLKIRSGGADAIDLKLKGVVDTSTIIKNANNSNISIKALNGTEIQVSGLSEGNLVTVYDIRGSIIATKKASENIITLSVPQKGMYVVKVIE